MERGWWKRTRKEENIRDRKKLRCQKVRDNDERERKEKRRGR